MPYIDSASRLRFDEYLAKLNPVAPGELAYVLYRIMKQYFAGTRFSYRYMAEAIGALETVKLEMYRREVAPYESSKMSINGDV